jgi:hypothetical protein
MLSAILNFNIHFAIFLILMERTIFIKLDKS